MIVDTRDGQLEGAQHDGVAVFKGIPYAAPPIGTRRFAPPAPPEPWSGVRPALHFGASAPQGAYSMERMFGGGDRPSSEDCLYLNVWTPGLDERRPVMVWIHGGAFTSGSGGVPWYHGDRFAARDIVVVTINYRLGPFGFLHLGDVGGEAFAGSGNAGILDQVAALEWVHDNIEAFGGDPDDVTVFGESAGAMSIGTLLGLPSARGLFRKAILQSGASSLVHDAETATELANVLLHHAGVGIDGLRELSTEAVMAAAGAMENEARSRAGRLAFQPVVDGVTLPRRPLDAIADGAARDVGVIVGTNLDEWKLFAMLDPRMQGLDELVLQSRSVDLLGDPDRARHALDVYRRRLPQAPAGEVLGAVITDSVFRIPAIRLAETHRAAGGDAWMYLFTWASTAFGGALGSCHALEIPFVFDALHKAGVDFLTGPNPPQSLADAMHGAWAAFASTGDPGWPDYDSDRRPTMRFDATSEVVDDPLGDERRCWA